MFNSLCFSALLSGWLRDITGSYICSFMVAGGFLIVGTIITTTLPYFCSCADPPPQLPKTKTKNEFTEDLLLRQVLSLNSTENIQNTDRIQEVHPSQNHIIEAGEEVEDTTVSADRTENGATCWLDRGAAQACHENYIDQGCWLHVAFFFYCERTYSVYRETVYSKHRQREQS